MTCRYRSLYIFVLLASLASCSGDDDFKYVGEAGQATTLSRRSWVPWVDAKLDGEPLSMIVDTGLPMTTLYQSELATLEPGRGVVEMEAFGLQFPRLEVVVVGGEASERVCRDEPPAGLVGYDLLSHFNLLLDYRGDRITLDDKPLQHADDDVDPPEDVPLQILGGGRLTLEDELLQVPATRLVVEAGVEGGDARAAIVDTGASLTIIRKKAFDKLGGSDRPQMCCVSVALIEGTKKASLSRLRQISVGGVTVKNIPVVVFEADELFTSLAAEIGRPVDLLVGGSFLRKFAVELSYRARTLNLHRYTNSPHIESDEYLLPGFSFCEAAQAKGMVVLDVYEGTDAERKGIEPGNVLLTVDGNDVTKLSAEETLALLRSREAGATARLTFQGVDDKDVHLDIAVEQMLPDYP